MAYIAARTIRGAGGQKFTVHIVDDAADLPSATVCAMGDLGVSVSERGLFIVGKTLSSLVIGNGQVWRELGSLAKANEWTRLQTFSGGAAPRSGTVAELETWALGRAAVGAALPAGTLVFATDGRAIGEGSGAGTGTIAWRVGSTWKIANGSTLAA